MNDAASEAGAAAEVAASRKEVKYADIDSLQWSPVFEPIAIRNSVFSAPLLRLFLNEIGKRIFINIGKITETSFLFQHV